MKSIPGIKLVHYAPLISAIIVVANDFWLKRQHPGFISGKLSDFGLCFLLPVILFSVWEWMTWIYSKIFKKLWKPGGIIISTISCLITVFYFSGLKLSQSFAHLHVAIISKLFPFLYFYPVVLDLTDLTALIMIPISWFYLKRTSN